MATGKERACAAADAIAPDLVPMVEAAALAFGTSDLVAVHFTEGPVTIIRPRTDALRKLQRGGISRAKMRSLEQPAGPFAIWLVVLLPDFIASLRLTLLPAEMACT